MNEEILNTEPAKTLELVVLPSDAVKKEIEMNRGDENVVSVDKQSDTDTEYKFTAVHPGKTRVITRATDSSLVTNILEVEVTSSQSINVHFNGGEEGTFKTYYRDIPDTETERDYFETYSYYGDDREYKNVYYQLGKVYSFEERSSTSGFSTWFKETFKENPKSGDTGIIKCIPNSLEPSSDLKPIWVKTDGTVVNTDEIEETLNNYLYYGSIVTFTYYTDESTEISGLKRNEIGTIV